jgi:signal peptidase
MNPTLYPGDVVITREVSPTRIQVGDVIRFHRDGIDFVHRVTDIQQAGGQIVFTTRGDNNNVADAPVPAGVIEGKVILTLPKIGWISIYLRQALSWIGGVL